jgi:hypothetical protein
MSAEVKVDREIAVACDSHISWCRHRHRNDPDAEREMDGVIAYLRKLTDAPAEANWQGREPNHYDWFMPERLDLSDEALDELEAKLTEALQDFYVHDMSQAVLPWLAEVRRLRTTLHEMVAGGGWTHVELREHARAALAQNEERP